MEKEWFVSWFDTKWYHQLYNKRNDEEAQRFMDSLIEYLKPSADSRILDLACGKGRHSVYLAEKGFEVTGVDLSQESIVFAQQFAHEKLHFEVHDMRQLYRPKAFDFVFNLFTSFGYFESEEEHVNALKMMGESLIDSGRLVIDFLNAPKVRKGLIHSEVETRNDIEFEISRKADDKYVTKQIIVKDDGEQYTFYERVRLFELADFERMFAKANLELIQVFGNYALAPYGKKADRLILIARKKN